MAYSAFDDRDLKPRDSDLAAVLGDSQDLWTDLQSKIEEQFQPLSVDWTFSGKKWGWSLRLKQKKRAVLYMTPRSSYFVAGLAVGQRAVDAAHQSDLPQSTLEMIDGSDVYAEGRAVRFEVRTREDVGTAVRIAAIKMAN
jgi:hypothetical protein